MSTNTDWNKIHFNNTGTLQKSAVIKDGTVTNNYELNLFLIFLSGLDKLHDFGDYFTAIYNLIYQHHFRYNVPPQTSLLIGRKLIGLGGEKVESDLGLKISSLHKLIDFNSYKTGTPPIYGAPDLMVQTASGIPAVTHMNFNSKAPFALAPINISKFSDDTYVSNYMLQIPPEKDVILHLRGRKGEFKEKKFVEVIRRILGTTAENSAYISKDAFPLEQEIIDKIFNRTLRSDFTSYTSEIMDPATQKKKIISGKDSTVETFFCVLPDNRRLYLKVKAGDKKELTLSFVLVNKNSREVGTSKLTINSITKTPSILDVVIYLFMEEYNGIVSKNTAAAQKVLAKSYGIKIMNAFKQNNKDQTSLAIDLKKKYFDPLFIAIPASARQTLTEKQLISIATKTIGDQSYLWDALISEGISVENNKSFVATVDSFLFEQIIHGKNANTVFASKSNGGALRNALLGSIYQMAIYLKPVDVKELGEIMKERSKQYEMVLEQVNQEYIVLEINQVKAEELIYKFMKKRTETIEHLINIFSSFKPEVGRRIPSYYTMDAYPNNQIQAFDISNYYYAACYLLQFMIQCELSLIETKSYKMPILPENDITLLKKELILIKSANGKYDDANEYNENTLTVLENVTSVFNYLKGNETSPGERNAIGLIEPMVGYAPDFESGRTSLNINKTRLEGMFPIRGIKLPYTIGFSKGFFLIKETVNRFFEGYNIEITKTKRGRSKSNEPTQNTKKRRVGGRNIIESETEILNKLTDIFEHSDWKKVFIVPTNASTGGLPRVTPTDSVNLHEDTLDYYELLFILKQLFYLNEYINNKKNVDDFYFTVYELSMKTKLHKYIFDENDIKTDIVVHLPKALKKRLSKKSSSKNNLINKISSSKKSSKKKTSKNKTSKKKRTVSV
jgi:hypothetical protein